MTNLRLEFSYPWLLLLLIPAAVLTFLPYFRLAKKYRRTRNRVTSIILHSIVMTLAILVLSGLTFHYELPNKDNELLLLVDASYSNRQSQEDKEDFVEKVLAKCGENYKVGVVKFGYNQVYAAPLTNSPEEAFTQYMQSEDPDTSATDVEAALRYADSLLTKPKTSKIVLITDGIETDGEAFDVINRIAARGVKVDTMYYPNEKVTDAQLLDVTLPEGAEVGKEFNMSLTVASNITGPDQIARVTLFDNGENKGYVDVLLDEEQNTLEIPYKVSTPGLHQFRLEMGYENDTTGENNVYYTYMYIHVFEDILLIERDEGEGEELKSILTENEYKVMSLSIENDVEEIPLTVAGLCEYEQVILVNIANSDMPEGFDVALQEYVSEFGGGLFTVGGNNDVGADGELVPHAYNRDDMYGTIYQEMLPVQVVNYAPPIAVMLLIDSSGSMSVGGDSQTGAGSYLDLALRGARACLDTLTSFDDCGSATFRDKDDEELKVTPVSNRKEIEDAMEKMSSEANGGTVFQAAIEGAGIALSAVDVERRHIILVTDGQPSDAGKYEPFIEANYAKGITMSIVGIGLTDDTAMKMEENAKLGGGQCYAIYDAGKLAETMVDDLKAEAIAEIQYGEEFDVKIGDYNSVVSGIKQADIPKLTGYYGTKLKSGAIAPLKGKYIPIYATWKYGNGNVGSFMSDLSGNWSEEFINAMVGQQLINGMVDSLFPKSQMENSELIVKMSEDNYTTQLNVYTKRTENDQVEVIVTPISDEAVEYYQDKQIVVTADDGGTRYEFDITCGGIYYIRVVKKTLNAEGQYEVVTETSVYKSFAHSEEYNVFVDAETTGLVYLEELAKDGRGEVVTEPLEVFASFAKTIEKVFDPRWLFVILAIVLFLIDIAARKFKWKWIHEIIRERQAKKEIAK